MKVTARWKADTMSGIMLILDQGKMVPSMTVRSTYTQLAGWLRQRANGIGLLRRMWQPEPARPLMREWQTP